MCLNIVLFVLYLIGSFYAHLSFLATEREDWLIWKFERDKCGVVSEEPELDILTNLIVLVMSWIAVLLNFIAYKLNNDSYKFFSFKYKD